jgi:methyl-accepting chemotaxis protein
MSEKNAPDETPDVMEETARILRQPATKKATPKKGGIALAPRVAVIVLCSALLAGLLLAGVGWWLQTRDLERSGGLQLRGVRAGLADSLTGYIQGVRNDAAGLAAAPTIRIALQDLSVARKLLKQELNTLGMMTDEALFREINESLKKYYEETFITPLGRIRPGASTSVESFMHKDFEAMLLQYIYISKNPAPPWRKFENNGVRDIANFQGIDPRVRVAFVGTAYAVRHAEYHPYLLNQRDRMGYRDILLCDADGFVVYSVAKNLDFQGNLKFGPEVNTGLGRAFALAMTSASDAKGGGVRMTDVVRYPKQFDQPTLFYSAPVRDMSGNFAGAIIIQTDVSRLTALTSFRGQWAEAGLGRTGEAYIVGDDFLLRTESRFLDKVPEGEKRLILSPEGASLTQTTVDALRVDSVASQNGLNGNIGELSYPNYMGEGVIGSYQKLDVPDVSWALVVEQEKKELLAPTQNALPYWAIGVLAVGAIAALIGQSLSQTFLVRPVRKFCDTAERIARGEAAAQFEAPTQDELGDLAQILNVMVAEQTGGSHVSGAESAGLVTGTRDLARVVARASEGQLGARSRIKTGALSQVGEGLNVMLDNIGEWIRRAQSAAQKVSQENQALQTALALMPTGATSGGGINPAVLDQLQGLSSAITGLQSKIESARQAQTEQSEQHSATTQNSKRELSKLRQTLDQFSAHLSAMAAPRASSEEEVSGNDNASPAQVFPSGIERLHRIAKTVDRFSLQSDMLALNAAIEASRAGEYGKGFHAVADQLRVVADRVKGLQIEVSHVVGDLERAAENGASTLKAALAEMENNLAGLLPELSPAIATISELESSVGTPDEASSVTDLLASAKEDSHRLISELESVASALQNFAAQPSSGDEEASEHRQSAQSHAETLQHGLRDLLRQLEHFDLTSAAPSEAAHPATSTATETSKAAPDEEPSRPAEITPVKGKPAAAPPPISLDEILIGADESAPTPFTSPEPTSVAAPVKASSTPTASSKKVAATVPPSEPMIAEPEPAKKSPAPAVPPPQAAQKTETQETAPADSFDLVDEDFIARVLGKPS